MPYPYSMLRAPCSVFTSPPLSPFNLPSSPSRRPSTTRISNTSSVSAFPTYKPPAASAITIRLEYAQSLGISVASPSRHN